MCVQDVWAVIYSLIIFNTAALDPPAFREPGGYCLTLPPPHFNFYQHQALCWSQNFIDTPGIYCLEILQGNSLGFLHTDVTLEY